MAILSGKRYFAILLFGVALVSSAGGGQADKAEAPAIVDQNKLLETMRQYAEQYVSNLPNFVCMQVTRQFEAGKKPAHWHKGDTLTSKLVFSQGHEERSLELVNDKPMRAVTRRWRAPLTTEGEFGILLANVLGSGSDASFAWNGWETVRGKRLAVFDYSIDKEHSTLRLSLSDLVKGIVPYHGSIYADDATGAVRRITNSAFDIPSELQTKSISTTIDYDDVVISGRNYLLPVQAIVWLTTETGNVRNEIEFTGYRKFETDSVITYGPEHDPPQAQPRNPRDRP